MKPIIERLLACPVCSGDVTVRATDVVCVQCGRAFPIVRGVPIMTPDGTYESVPQPPVRNSYDPWIHLRTMATLLSALGDRAAIPGLGMLAAPFVVDSRGFWKAGACVDIDNMRRTHRAKERSTLWTDLVIRYDRGAR